MISTALDNLTAPPSYRLLGWHMIDSLPKDGWFRIGFVAKQDFLQSGRLRPGRHSLRDGRRHHGSAW